MLRSLFRRAWQACAILIAAAILYLVAALVLALIPINTGFQVDRGGVEIAIQDNGVHVDVILPVQAAGVDWTAEFPLDHFPQADPNSAFIAFGWGHREFYLNTPTWNEFDLMVGLRAVSGIGETTVHVAYRPWRGIGERTARTRISPESYRRLVAFIHTSYRRDADGRPIRILGYSYGGNDAFYEGIGRYSLINTCNEWASRALAAAEVRTGFWTPFPGAILEHIRQANGVAAGN